MKKILFDLSVCQPIGGSKFHGGGVYGYTVFRALRQKCSKNIGVYYDSRRFLPEDICRLITERQIDAYDASNILLIDAYRAGSYQKIYSPLFHSTYNQLISEHIPLMITIHGLRSLEMNRDKYEIKYAYGIEIIKAILKQTPIYAFLCKKYRKQYEVLLSSRDVSVITVSEHSKASIKFFYPGFDAEKIQVRYSPNTSEDMDSTFDIGDDKYYLLVSSNRWIKNAYRTIKAFEDLYRRDGKFCSKIYVVGIDEKHPVARKIKNKNNYRFFPYLDRSRLEVLYKNAYALVYPTLNEGFGYPPIEAMRYGTPVIASGVSSIPEIFKDSILCVNPYSENEIANRIIQMEDLNVREYFSKKAIERFAIIKERQDSDLDILIEDIIR